MRAGSLGDRTVRSGRPLDLRVAQKHGTPNFTCAETSAEPYNAVVADGRTYRFVSLHFHTPAENTVDGIAYPMEMHLVHLAEDGSGAIAVLGVLFEYATPGSPADETVAELLTHIDGGGGAEAGLTCLGTGCRV
jgi:carbonic anhydrase